ncbi:hypothetical protein JW921_10020 [Candidatus Fermentibacterales bacterium]|nr:hypothetical protein [Candidatus Fermentibacterales bacterium]
MGSDERLAVMCSGGLGSSVLLAASAQLLGNDRVLALTADSELLPSTERSAALLLAGELGVDHLLVPLPLTDEPALISNGPARCYHCRRLMVAGLRRAAGERGFESLADGRGADGQTCDGRGPEPIPEQGVLSPLAAAGMTRDMVRDLAVRLGVPGANRPPESCLATRLEAGMPLESARLALVDRLEGPLRSDAVGRPRLKLGRRDEATLVFAPEDSELVERHRDWLLEQLLAAGMTLIRFEASCGTGPSGGRAR